MSLGASACRRKARHACGDGLNPVALINSLGKLGGGLANMARSAPRTDVFWFVNSGYLFFAALSHSIKSCGFQVPVAVALVFGARVMLAATFQVRRPTPKVISQVILACGMCFTEFSC